MIKFVYRSLSHRNVVLSFIQNNSHYFSLKKEFLFFIESSLWHRYILCVCVGGLFCGYAYVFRHYNVFSSRQVKVSWCCECLKKSWWDTHSDAPLYYNNFSFREAKKLFHGVSRHISTFVIIPSLKASNTVNEIFTTKAKICFLFQFEL